MRVNNLNTVISITGWITNVECDFQLQLPTSSFIVIIVVTDPTNTTHYSRRLCLSAARAHISSDSRCFLESTQNLPVFSLVHALTDAYTPSSGLTVFTWATIYSTSNVKVTR